MVSSFVAVMSSGVHAGGRGGGGGLLQEQAGTVVFPAEATGGPSVLHSGPLIWVTFREQVPWISSHENEAPAPTEAQARRGAGAAWTASSQPQGVPRSSRAKPQPL